MNKSDFLIVLKNHDWTYMMSDDHDVWLKGEDSLKNIKSLIKNNDELNQVYITEYNKIFNIK